MRIIYVVSQWRAPTETFVRREVAAARKAGHDIVILSLKAPAGAAPDDPRVIRLNRGRLKLARSLLRHPARLAALLLRVAWFSRPATLGPNAVSAILGFGADNVAPAADWIHAHFAWVAA